MGQSSYVHLEGCTIVRETDKAFCVKHKGQEHWIPKSQIADADSLEEGDTDLTVSITEWIAEQKGIDADE